MDKENFKRNASVLHFYEILNNTISFLLLHNAFGGGPGDHEFLL